MEEAVSVEEASAVEEAVAVSAGAVAGSRRVVAAALCMILVAGCGSSVPPVDDGTADESGLRASASRTRDDDNIGGQFQTRLANTGRTTVHVVSVALESPGFEPAAPSVRGVSLGSGNQIDIPTQYGPARCDVAPTPASVSVVVDSGQTLSIPLETPYDVLDTIARQECTASTLARSVELTLRPFPDTGLDSLAAELVVERLDTNEPVRVDEVRGSVLYGLSARLPTVLGPDAESLVVPVEITAATCAAHSIADSKKPFVFPVFLAVGDADTVYARIPVPTAVQESVIAFQTRVCSTGG